MKNRIRVLVVDDSALMRKLIPMILERDPDIEVVGTAMDGAFALRKIAELQPDVVTLDLEMPRMDGIETLRMIMRSAPLPVIVFSTHSKQGAYSTFKALALGAILAHAGHQNADGGEGKFLRDGMKQDVDGGTVAVDRRGIGENGHFSARHAPNHHVSITRTDEHAAGDE